MEFDKDNGSNGRIPVTQAEWARVGVDSDERAANLMKYLYGEYSINSKSTEL